MLNIILNITSRVNNKLVLIIDNKLKYNFKKYNWKIIKLKYLFILTKFDYFAGNKFDFSLTDMKMLLAQPDLGLSCMRLIYR